MFIKYLKTRNSKPWLFDYCYGGWPKTYYEDCQLGLSKILKSINPV